MKVFSLSPLNLSFVSILVKHLYDSFSCHQMRSLVYFLFSLSSSAFLLSAELFPFRFLANPRIPSSQFIYGHSSGISFVAAAGLSGLVVAMCVWREKKILFLLGIITESELAKNLQEIRRSQKHTI